MLGILVLLHEDEVLDGLVAHLNSSVPWQHNLKDKPSELLHRAVKKHENDAGDGMPRLEQRSESVKVLVLDHCDEAEHEKRVVARCEDKHV